MEGRADGFASLNDHRNVILKQVRYCGLRELLVSGTPASRCVPGAFARNKISQRRHRRIGKDANTGRDPLSFSCARLRLAVRRHAAASG